MNNGQGSQWFIAIAGRMLVAKATGRITGESEECSPVYELIVQPTQQGVSRMVVPALFFSSERTMMIHASVPRIPFDTLNKQERRQMMKSIEHCEQMIGKMRAAESGLVLADKMPEPPR